jgi:hypothetical protein
MDVLDLSKLEIRRSGRKIEEKACFTRLIHFWSKYALGFCSLGLGQPCNIGAIEEAWILKL